MSQSAGRALDLLLAITSSQRPLGLIELASHLELDKSTCSRLLALLEHKALVSRGTMRKYQVGPAMVAAASVALRQRSLRRVARPFLVALRDESGETATLHLKLNYDRVCIDGVESASSIRRVVPLGETVPLVTGTSGKAILARLTALEVDEIVVAAAVDGEPLADLTRDVQTAKRFGFLADRAESEGIVAVASAIQAGPLGLGALTISGPWDRWTVEKARAFGPRVRAVASEIQHLMSYT